MRQIELREIRRFEKRKKQGYHKSAVEILAKMGINGTR